MGRVFVRLSAGDEEDLSPPYMVVFFWVGNRFVALEGGTLDNRS